MHPILSKFARQLPGFRPLDSFLRRRYTGYAQPERYRRGHFHSPLPDYQNVNTHAASLFSKDVDLGQSIQLGSDAQLALLEQFAQYYGDFDWEEQPRAGRRFYVPNGWFGEGDSIILYCMLRHFQPRHVIEAGSGFSSALMLDTDERFLKGLTRFTFVDPNPERLFSLLREGGPESAQIIRAKVQDLPVSTFSILEPNDILFIDSSHVSKIGSDVNYLVFEVLPRLRSGVVVHFHDIQWPFEYSKQWIMEGRAWNEAYLLRAFLQYNHEFEILMFNSYIAHEYASFLEQKMPRFLKDTGGSLWLLKH